MFFSGGVEINVKMGLAPVYSFCILSVLRLKSISQNLLLYQSVLLIEG